MTTDLRAQVVEAMAQAIRDAEEKRIDDLGNRADGWASFEAHAAAALDAALDVLGEHYSKPTPAEDFDTDWLLDTLRAGKGSEG